jgi:hypothetical protein
MLSGKTGPPDRLMEVGLQESRGGGEPAMRLHLAKRGVDTCLCGKPRAGLQKATVWDYKFFCRNCNRQALTEGLPLPD